MPSSWHDNLKISNGYTDQQKTEIKRNCVWEDSTHVLVKLIGVDHDR